MSRYLNVPLITRRRPIAPLSGRRMDIILASAIGIIIANISIVIARNAVLGRRMIFPSANPQSDAHQKFFYLWILKVTTPSGKKLSRTGTITIIK